MKRIWKDVFRMAGAVQKTCSAEMLGGLGADYIFGASVHQFWKDDFA